MFLVYIYIFILRSLFFLALLKGMSYGYNNSQYTESTSYCIKNNYFD